MTLEQATRHKSDFSTDAWMSSDLRDHEDESYLRGGFDFCSDLRLRRWIVDTNEVGRPLDFIVFVETVALGVARTSFQRRDLCKYFDPNQAGFHVSLSQWGGGHLKMLALRLRHFSSAELSRPAEIIIEVEGQARKLTFSDERFSRLELLAAVDRALGVDRFGALAEFAELEFENEAVSTPADALVEATAASGLLYEMRSGPRYRAGIDLPQEGVLRGWAVDLLNPAKPIDVALVADGRFVASGRTSTRRWDIDSFLPGNLAGFSLDLRACSDEALLVVLDRIDKGAPMRSTRENCLAVALDGGASWIEAGEFAVTTADLRSQVELILEARQATDWDDRGSSHDEATDLVAASGKSYAPIADFAPPGVAGEMASDETRWLSSRLASEQRNGLIMLECLSPDPRGLAESREQAGDDMRRLLAFVLKDMLARQSGLGESVKAHASAIADFFDPFPYSADPSARLTKIDNPLLHYILIGWREGRRPHPLFDPQYYKTQFEADIGEPLLHFVRAGARAGLNPHPLFDTKFYRANYLLGDLDINPLLHYLTIGGRCRFDPSPLFNTAKFLRDAPMAKTSSCPLETFVVTKALHDLEIVPAFDAKLYRYQLERERGETLVAPPIVDYLGRGYRDKTLLPNMLFDPAYYRERNAISFEGPDLLHYLEAGERAGLECHPFFSSAFYNEQRGVDPDGVTALEQAWRHPDHGLRANSNASGPIDQRLLQFVCELIEKRDEFDVAFYRAINPDLRTMTDCQIEEHYRRHALPENRVTDRAKLMDLSGARIADINLGFYADEYVYLNADLQYLEGNFLGAFGHYMRHSRRERDRLIGKWQLHCNDLEFEVPTANAPLRVVPDEERIELAIVIHVFYPELWSELAGFARNFSDQRCDIFINLVDEIWTPKLYRDIRTACPGAFLLLSNDSGRDVGGLMRILDTIQIRQYKTFVFMHTKKSPHIAPERGAYWRHTLLKAIAGNKDIANANITLFNQDPTIGLMGAKMWRSTDIAGNHIHYDALLDMFAIERNNRSVDYISGFMFIVKSEVLETLHDRLRDVAWEYGGDKDLEFHQDGQIAHGVERLLPALVRQMGYKIVYR